MEENKQPEPQKTEGFLDWMDGFLTGQGLPGKLRGAAKGLLIIGIIWAVYLLFGLGWSSFLFTVPGAFLILGIAWLLYAVADIHEKTAENNAILRQAFPEHIPQKPEEEPKE